MNNFPYSHQELITAYRLLVHTQYYELWVPIRIAEQLIKKRFRLHMFIEDLLDMKIICTANIKLLVRVVHVSRVVRKPTYCICENKGADPLCSNCAADQGLCFLSIDGWYNTSIISLIRHFKPLTNLSCSTARFVSDLVGNPKTGFVVTRLM